MSQNFSHTIDNNRKIDITAFGNSNLQTGNCLIFIHGFKGFKDWGFGPFLAQKFANQGNFVITFNFSCNGVGTNSQEFDELEKFANNTYSYEIDEVNIIIELYKSGFFGYQNDQAKIGLIGHSRGGGIAIISASLNNNIDAVVTWSAISKFDRFTRYQKEEWNGKGYIEMQNARTKQMMRINKVLFDDLEKNKNKLLNMELALKNIQIPMLFIHGDQDLAVPLSEAEQIYRWSNKSFTELFIIKGTGHTFDIKHPFESTTKAFDIVLEQTSNFFQNHLQS